MEKQIEVDNKNKIKKLKNIKKKTKKDNVNLDFPKEIELYIDDNIIIKFTLDEKGYCAYKNKKAKESYVSIMPKDLYEWVTNKL